MEMVGGQRTLLELQDTDADVKALVNVEPGGGEALNVGDFEEVVEAERLDLRGEQVQRERKQGMGGRQVLAAMGLMEEMILDQRQFEFKENQDAGSITEVAVLEVNETNRIRGLCGAIFEIPANPKEIELKTKHEVEDEWEDVE